MKQLELFMHLPGQQRKKGKKKKVNKTEEELRLSTKAKELVTYFISQQTGPAPKLSSWFSKNIKMSKNLLKSYSLEECKNMIDNIMNDRFWKDKMTDLGPIIKAPHKWLTLKSAADLLFSDKKNEENKKKQHEIESYIFYDIFNGDPLDNEGKTIESNIRSAIEQYNLGKNLEVIYDELKKRVRKK